MMHATTSEMKSHRVQFSHLQEREDRMYNCIYNIDALCTVKS